MCWWSSCCPETPGSEVARISQKPPGFSLRHGICGNGDAERLSIQHHLQEIEQDEFAL